MLLGHRALLSFACDSCIPSLALHAPMTVSSLIDVHCRMLNNLRSLSHQLSTVMHSFRQQLIDQALHAANTAEAAATAADDGSGASLDDGNTDLATAPVISTTAQQVAPVFVPATAAAAAVTAVAVPSAHPSPDIIPSPFANSEEAVPFLQPGSAERQGRRQEISGSLPLEQMLSRLPSPVGTAAGLERASSDGNVPSRRASRLGSSLDLSQLSFPSPSQPPMPGLDSTANPNTVYHTQDQWSQDSFGQRTMSRRGSRLGSSDSPREGSGPEHSQLPAMQPQAVSPPHVLGRTQTAAAAVITPSSSQGQASHSRRLMNAAQGLQLAPGVVGHSIPQPITGTASPSVSQGKSASQLSHAARSAAADPGSAPADPGSRLSGELSSGRPIPQYGGYEAVYQGAVDSGRGEVSNAVEGDIIMAQLEAEAEARIKAQQQQHPWLLYFYDRETERDYSRYHTQHMSMVSRPGTQAWQSLT